MKYFENTEQKKPMDVRDGEIPITLDFDYVHQ